MNLARDKGYASVTGAKRKLEKSVPNLTLVHHVIAVNDEGRFVPCVVGSEHMELIHRGITVLGG